MRDKTRIFLGILTMVLLVSAVAFGMPIPYAFQDHFRKHLWDETGQLAAAVGNEYCGYYGYNANGERVYKLTGSVYADQYNAGEVNIDMYFDDMVLYVNPYMVITPRGYTKHYYNGSHRIAARLGDYWADSGMMMDESDRMYQAREVLEERLNSTEAEEDFLVDEIYRSVYGDEFYVEPYILRTNYMNCGYTEDMLYDVFNGNIRQSDDVGGVAQGIFYYHSDHLGSASWITDDQGQAVQYIHYMPYGELWENQQSNSYDERFKFTWKERDTETGYDYFGARYYSPMIGHWLSPDPLLDEYPEISSYAYCRWNPLKYVDPNGKDAYIFGEDGSFIRSEQESGQHYGVMLKGDKVDYTFDFADPINDPQAIDNGKINGVIIPTDEQISDILDNSGVYSPENQELKNRYSYAYRESNSGKVYGDGKMDYVITGKYNGSEIINYENYLFLTDVNGKKVAHNNYNFGNFLWGAGISALGIPYFAAKVGSNLNNFLNDPYSKWHFDSKDDQLSIKLGFQWQRRSK